MMGKIKIIMLLCLTLLLGSCVKEELISGGNVPEDESAIVSVSLKGAQMGSGTTQSRALSEADEQKINNIHVLIFKADGTLVTNMHFDSYEKGIEVPTYSGNNRTIYVVANGDAHTNIDKDLIKVKRRSDLDAIVVENSEHDLQRTKGLLMAGEILTDIKPGKSFSSAIQLHYLSAKVTLIVIDNTGKNPNKESVQILGWDVVDASAKGYLNEKENGTDAVDINTPTDFFTTDAKYPFETKDEGEKSVTQEMYLFENHRGGRAEKALPTDKSKRYPDMEQNDGNDKGKAWYAPEKATHILIYAMHNQDTSTKQILAKIYIGKDNHSDYNIARSNHYTFTVTVNGLKDINVDSNVAYVDGGLRVDYGTNLAMDTHSDFRPIRLMAADGAATIEILDENDRTYDDPSFSAKWLKISPINLMNVQIKQSGEAGDWQESVNTGSFARGKYIPHQSVRQKLAEKGISGWNAIPSGKENDDVMTLEDAKYRMCYKITAIPFDDPSIATPQILNIYADENETTTRRTAKVLVTYLKKNNNEDAREKKTLEITQEGLLTIFNSTDAGLQQLDGNGAPIGSKKRFAIEHCEEPALIMNPGIGLNFQQTKIMQWGFAGKKLYDGKNKYRNGSFLTVNAVFNDDVVKANATTGLPEWATESSSYRTLYGNSDGPLKPYTGTQLPPYYLPMPPDKAKIYHPIFNSSAARYCYEKNRDVNGDGKIDKDEAIWYLPSHDEILMVMITNTDEVHNTTPKITIEDAYSAPNDIFWTSTERSPYQKVEDSDGNPSGPYFYETFVTRVIQGFAPSQGGGDTYRVRCIRTMP